MITYDCVIIQISCLETFFEIVALGSSVESEMNVQIREYCVVGGTEAVCAAISFFLHFIEGH